MDQQPLRWENFELLLAVFNSRQRYRPENKIYNVYKEFGRLKEIMFAWELHFKTKICIKQSKN